MNEKLVSIIIPTYNCGEFIEETLNSVINQSYKNWEAIVIDDCSIDNTKTLVTKYTLQDSRIKYYRLKENRGAAFARNTGIKMAEGGFIAFLDSDDLWNERKLELQIEYMIKNNKAFCCTSYNKINEKSKDLNKVIVSQEKMLYKDLLKHCPGNSTVVYNKDKLGKFYIDNIKKRNDYLMWLNIIKKSKELCGIPQVLASHRIRENSISSNKFSLVKYHYKIYTKYENLGIVKSLILCNFWVFKSLLGRIK